MANIMRLWHPVEWGYDLDTGQLVLRLRERDDANPDVDPTREAIVRLDIASITVRDL